MLASVPLLALCLVAAVRQQPGSAGAAREPSARAAAERRALHGGSWRYGGSRRVAAGGLVEKRAARQEEALTEAMERIHHARRVLDLTQYAINDVNSGTAPPSVCPTVEPTLYTSAVNKLRRWNSTSSAHEDQNGTSLPDDGEIEQTLTTFAAYETGLSQTTMKVRACKQTFWYNWDSMVHVHRNGEVFVKTGDIPDMWTRDSAAQMYPYVQLLKRSSPPKKPTASSGNVSNGVIIGVLEGFIKTSARLLISDPYANSYSEDVKPLQTTKESFKLNRGGSVATGNFELDSGPHFLRLVAAYNRAVPGSKVMEDEALRVAIRTLLTLYRTEQHHTHSQYAYEELPFRGRGNPVTYTGMVWTGFRASDDQAVFGYNIPDNLFLAAMLLEVPDLVKKFDDGDDLSELAQTLREDILKGVREYGMAETEEGKIYCYEVDGLGNCLQMDDANMPSLLSIPYFDPEGRSYDKAVYATTREWVLSDKNPFFFKDPIPGIGSPHTTGYRAWPMAVVVEALTNGTKSVEKEKLGRLRDVLQKSSTQSDLGGVWMHESIGDHPSVVTRESFGWAEALYSELLIKAGCCKVSWKEAWYPHGWKSANDWRQPNLMKMSMPELRALRESSPRSELSNPERVALPGETASDPGHSEDGPGPVLPKYARSVGRAEVNQVLDPWALLKERKEKPEDGWFKLRLHVNK